MRAFQFFSLAMAEQKTITATSSRFSARLFNYLSIATTLVSASLYTLGSFMTDKKMAFLPLAMSLPPVMIWVAASMFVYAAIAHHPNLRVRHFNKWAGYRYYAIIGLLVVVANDAAHLIGWGGIWVFFVLSLVPWSLYDIWKAGREEWQDTVIEVQHHD
jgi:hypothetical protein